QLINLVFRHTLYARYLITMLVEQSHPQCLLQIVIVVIAYVSFRTFGNDDTMPLLPYAKGVGFYSGKVLNVPDTEFIHFIIPQKSCRFISNTFSLIVHWPSQTSLLQLSSSGRKYHEGCGVQTMHGL